MALYQENWRVVVDRGDGSETLIHEGRDIDKVFLRLGQMVMSLGIEQIVVYRDGEEYRRYVLAGRAPAEEKGRQTTWRRYHFSTRAIYDYRPLIFDPAYPWWCSAESDDAATIVAYLPADKPLQRYWPDAFDIECTEAEEPTFSDRFPKPDWYTG